MCTKKFNLINYSEDSNDDVGNVKNGCFQFFSRDFFLNLFIEKNEDVKKYKKILLDTKSFSHFYSQTPSDNDSRDKVNASKCTYSSCLYN